jgi:hypothetical protein
VDGTYPDVVAADLDDKTRLAFGGSFSVAGTVVEGGGGDFGGSDLADLYNA